MNRKSGDKINLDMCKILTVQKVMTVCATFEPQL